MIEPKLRFKADDGSQFPDWEEKKLGDITEKVVRKNENSNADVRMISQGNGFILQSDKYSRENAGQSLKKYTLLKRDEFAYNHGASKVKPYGVCYRLCESDEARVPYVYHTFRLVDDDSDFWNYSLNTSYMDRQLKKKVSSGARMDGLLNISYDAYMSVNIHVPSLPEQQKIAEFLSTIDTVIEKQKETVSAWEERKKGVMQKLFSQEVRFKTDDGSDFPEWEEKKIDDLFYKVNERNNGQFGKDKWISVAKMYYQDEDKVTSNNIDTRTYVMRVGDMSFEGHPNKEFKYGRFVVNDIGDGIISELFPIYRHKENYILKYWKYAIQVDSIMQKIYRKSITSSGASSNKLDDDDFKRQSILVPCLAEQQKIADCLSSLDEVIEKQKSTLAAWEEMKKGLLQQMFV